MLHPESSNYYFFIVSSEILRVVDSMQLTDKKKVATPVDWKVVISSKFYWLKNWFCKIVYSSLAIIVSCHQMLNKMRWKSYSQKEWRLWIYHQANHIFATRTEDAIDIQLRISLWFIHQPVLLNMNCTYRYIFIEMIKWFAQNY